MPYYETDDIECWFRSCWEERYESFAEDYPYEGVCDESTPRADMRSIIYHKSCDKLEEWATEMMELSEMKTSSSLACAVLNSVDWVDLMATLSEWTTDYDDEEEKEWNRMCARRNFDGVMEKMDDGEKEEYRNEYGFEGDLAGWEKSIEYDKRTDPETLYKETRDWWNEYLHKKALKLMENVKIEIVMVDEK